MTIDAFFPFGPSHIIVAILDWIKDHLPSVIGSIGVSALKNVGQRALKKFLKKKEEEAVKEIAEERYKPLTDKEIEMIVTIVKDELIAEIKQKGIEVPEEQILRELYQAVVYILTTMVNAFTEIMRNRDDIETIEKTIEVIMRQLEGEENLISMLFNSDVAVNNELERLQNEINTIKNTLQGIQQTMQENRDEWQDTVMNLQSSLDRLKEDIMKEIWQRYLFYTAQTYKRIVTPQQISYFGERLEYILLIHDSGLLWYYYFPPLKAGAQSEASVINGSTIHLASGLFKAMFDFAHDAFSVDITQLETERSYVVYSNIDNQALLVASFKKDVIHGHVTAIVKAIADKIKNILIPVPAQISNELTGTKKEVIDSIIEDFVFNISLDPKNLDYFKNNLQHYINLKYVSHSTNTVEVAIEIAYMPSAIQKIDLTVRRVYSQKRADWLYNCSRTYLEFMGVNSFHVILSKLSFSGPRTITSDVIVFEFVATINGKSEMLGPFQKELRLDLHQPGLVRLLDFANNILTFKGLEDDGTIVTDQLIRGRIYNEGDEPVEISASLFSIQVFQSENDVVNGNNALPSLIIIDHILPEPYSLKPKEKKEIIFKLKAIEDLKYWNYLILKIASRHDPDNYELLKLTLS